LSLSYDSQGVDSFVTSAAGEENRCQEGGGGPGTGQQWAGNWGAKRIPHMSWLRSLGERGEKVALKKRGGGTSRPGFPKGKKGGGGRELGNAITHQPKVNLFLSYGGDPFLSEGRLRGEGGRSGERKKKLGKWEMGAREVRSLRTAVRDVRITGNCKDIYGAPRRVKGVERGEDRNPPETKTESK